MGQMVQRFALDPTGMNPDNLVSGEVIQLTDRQFRCVVPRHSPFFVDSVRLYDGATMQLLRKDQYSFPMLSQEATLRFGEQIADSIIIEDSAVGSTVLATYQVLGGMFQNNIANVVSIFETFLNDKRAIDWVTGVYGKPNQYPPSDHAHAVADLFGFEALTFVFEQIRQAILLGNTPAYEMIFEALNKNTASKKDVEEGNVNTKNVTLNVLQHSDRLYNHNTFKLTPMFGAVRQKRVLNLSIEASWPQGEIDNIYWKINHTETDPSDFVLNSGIVQLLRGAGQLNIQATDVSRKLKKRKFEIIFYRGGIDKLELFRSFEIYLRSCHLLAVTILAASTTCCINSPTLAKTPSVFSVNRGIWGRVQS